MAPGSDKKNTAVTIKGNAGGLLVRLLDDEEYLFSELLNELEGRLEQSGKFFLRAHTSVDLGRREVDQSDLELLQGLMARHEIKLEKIISGSNSTRSVARRVGIEFLLPNRENTRLPHQPERETNAVPFDNAEALFVRRTLRSGQLLKHHGDICLLGDLNPGAQIIAGGNVIVWGIVRGVIEAGVGVTTEQKSVVCALQLTPSLLRIGEVLARAPETHSRNYYPEIARVNNGSIVIEQWKPHRK
ncbi:septum site-determining protein MinC [Candidatus Chlorohelix sp.]|uniref:septum site-determining protein MinC n=1 Tax=Candidatus Chlorohelix sp. TaxID=3139201 RepID=UPI00303E8B2E